MDTSNLLCGPSTQSSPYDNAITHLQKCVFSSPNLQSHLPNRSLLEVPNLLTPKPNFLLDSDLSCLHVSLDASLGSIDISINHYGHQFFEISISLLLVSVQGWMRLCTMNLRLSVQQAVLWHGKNPFLVGLVAFF